MVSSSLSYLPMEDVGIEPTKDSPLRNHWEFHPEPIWKIILPTPPPGLEPGTPELTAPCSAN